MTKPNNFTTFVIWFGLVSGFASLIGLPLSIWFFVISREAKEPKFLVEAPIGLVNYSKLENPPSTATNQDSEQIQSFSRTHKFYFWNAGKESIKRENILQRITIRLAANEFTNKEILDFSCTNIARENITEFTLERVDTTTLLIDFNILEKNDGATCHVMTNSPAKLLIAGTIEEVGRLNNKSLAPNDQAYLGRIYARALIATAVSIMTIYSSVRIYKGRAIDFERVLIIPLASLNIYFIYVAAMPIIEPNQALRYDINHKPIYQIPSEITEHK